MTVPLAVAVRFHVLVCVLALSIGARRDTLKLVNVPPSEPCLRVLLQPLRVFEFICIHSIEGSVSDTRVLKIGRS